jgi:hypothetical protein
LTSLVLIVIGLLLASGVVSASTGSQPFVVSTYIASGEVYVSITPVNPSLVSNTYNVLVVYNSNVNVYNGTFKGASGDTFTIPAEYPNLLVEILSNGVVVQEQTVQGIITTTTGAGTSVSLPLIVGVVEGQLAISFAVILLIIDRKLKNEDKIPDEYIHSMDEGDMLVTKELFRKPAKTKEQGEDRLKLYMWLKNNGYEIDTKLKPPKR